MKRPLAIVSATAAGALLAPEVTRAVAVWSAADLDDVLGRAQLTLLRVTIALVTAAMAWALLEHLLPPRDSDGKRRDRVLGRRVRVIAILAVVGFALVEAVLAWPAAADSWRGAHARKVALSGGAEQPLDRPCATRQPWPAGEARLALGRGERLQVHVSDAGRAHVRSSGGSSELVDGATFVAPRSAWFTVEADAGAPLCLELAR